MTRKVVASTYMTLDGFIDEPGMWSFPFWCEEAMQFKAKELWDSDAQLLGRLTYEGFAAAWPTMEGTGEFGEKMNSMPKYVASRTLETATWNATIIKDKRLFNGVPQRTFTLVDTLIFPTGVVVNTYGPAAAPAA
jgi:dihydrofolate reductase